MKKLAALGAGTFAVSAAIASAALLSPPVAGSEPVNVNGLNVVGEPYGRALAILKSQNVKAFFGGSHGSDLPQAECIVDQQKITGGGKMFLSLNCTEEAAADAADSLPVGGGTPGGPTVGSNGVTTVTPTPVGPQPGMPIG